MYTEHLLPSTRITAARIAARATEERVRRFGLDTDKTARLATLAANLTRIVSPEMAVMIATARAREIRHV